MSDKNRDMTLEEAERIVDEQKKRDLIAQAKQIRAAQKKRPNLFVVAAIIAVVFSFIVAMMMGPSGRTSSTTTVESAHAPSLPKAKYSDAVATQKFGAYVQSLNDAAGGNLIHKYRVQYCGVILTIDADIWEGLSVQDKQTWMDKVIEDQTNVSPQCVSNTGKAPGVKEILFDLAGNQLPDPYGDR